MSIKPCDTDVFENGQSVCMVDIPKETAEVICQNLSAVTGCKIDWHYIGGRVHIKAIAAPVVERQEPVAWIDPFWVKHQTENSKQWVRVTASLAENRINGYTMPLYAEQPAPVAVVPSLWYVRVPDDPADPESPCEYFYAGSEWHRDQLLQLEGASVSEEYACLDKVKELNP